MLRALASASLCMATALAQANFPAPPTPASNPRTPAKELLGMALFFEEQLSSTGTVACGTCHDFVSGGVDPRAATSANPGADGVFGTADDQRGSPGISAIQADGTVVPSVNHGFSPNVTPRRTPTVINSGYHTHLAYDGSKTSLEQLIAVPPLNTTEMGHVGRTWADVATKIAGARPLAFASDLPQRLQNFIGTRTYPELFQIAFGSSQVTQSAIVNAIACYLRTLNSDQSKFDLFRRGFVQLTALEQQGLALFSASANGATSCRTCHGDFEARVSVEGPVVGQFTTTATGPYGSLFPTRLMFHNVGIRPPAEDPGRQNVTVLNSDAGKFRVASLRNVELTAPYFHNGSVNTLHDVVEFYNRGGDFHVNQAANLFPRNYSIVEKDAIVALLRTLTDPRVAAGVAPFDRPTLGTQSMSQAIPCWESETTQSGQLLAQAPFAPLLGDPWFRLTLSGATPGVPAFLMLDTGIGPDRLAFNVILSGTPAFTAVYAGQAQALPGVTRGFAQMAMPLPNLPALSGQVVFAQWLVLEPSQQFPLATSNALYIPLR